MNKEFENIIQNWSKAQKAGAVLPCPRCGVQKMKDDISKNVLSRRADICVCSACGVQESLEDMNYRDKFEHHSDEYKEHFIKQWWLIRSVLGREEIIGNELGDWEIKVSRTVFVTKQDIDDIMVCALEGGITYWCSETEVVEKEYFGEYASDQISRGGSLKLYDCESDETYILTLEKLLNGLVLAAKKGYADEWFDDARLDTMNIDSEAADIIIQMALFGYVVYG